MYRASDSNLPPTLRCISVSSRQRLVEVEQSATWDEHGGIRGREHEPHVSIACKKSDGGLDEDRGRTRRRSKEFDLTPHQRIAVNQVAPAERGSESYCNTHPWAYS